MKLFYFGSVCDNNIFNETVERSKIKPSASAQNFETALINGFSGNSAVSLSIASAESIATYPNGSRLYLRKRRDVLNEKCTTNIIPAINLPLFKQFFHAHGAEKLLIKWLEENQEDKDKCVLVYGIYPHVVKRLQLVCKKYACKIFAIVTDVPSTMFTYTQRRGFFKRVFAGSYRESAMSIQDKFDGYIYLTAAMSNEVAPGKPFTVVETIADTTIFNQYNDIAKAAPPALMYAGTLYRRYGIELILDIFEHLNFDCELWLFGSSDCEDEIRRRAGSNPKIKFFGRVPRSEVLRREKMAALLLNVRNADDEYTKYSFPSKMVEYMLSGTPLLTTKLSGIPEEYYNYCYASCNRDAVTLAEKISIIMSDSERNVMAKKAQNFVNEQKNCYIQADKILQFLNQHISAKG